MKKRNLVFLLAIFSLAFVPFANVYAVDTKVEVSGYDEDGTTLLAGVTLQVLDEDKNVVVDSIQTDGTTYTDVTEFVEENKQYYLHELAPPQGYAPGEDISFTVQPNQEQQFGITNKPLYLMINKVDDNNDYVEGALLELKKVSTNEVIDSWTSSGEGGYVVDSSKLEYGETYQIVETRVPVGYLAYELTKTFTLNSESMTINFENKELNITIANFDENNNPLAGVIIQIQDEDENVIEEFITSDSAYEINSKLEIGKTYYIVETSIQNGYNLKPKKAFTITDDLNQEYSITNERVSIVVNSLDQNDNLVANVKYNVLNNEGQKLFDFTTGSTSYSFTEEQMDDIAYNGTYKIVATGTTDGYILDTEEHEFTVNQDSNVIDISHTRIAVTINNYKADNVTPLIGAKLQIIKASDNSVVESEWTTDGNAHELSAILENNTVYKIHQVEVPKGYTLAEDVSFTVNSDASQLYTIKNDTIKISVLKTDNYNEPLAGALLQLIEKDGSNEKIIDSWTSTTGAYEIPFDKIEGNLDLSKTHILRETTAPTGYETTTDQTIQIVSTGDVQTFVMSNNPSQKIISFRVYKNGTTTFVPGTHLELYEGEEIDSEKLVHSWTSSSTPVRFDTLDSTYSTPALKYGRKYTVHVVAVSDGYVLPQDYTFTLDNSLSSDQNIYVKSLSLNVSKVDSDNQAISGARLQIKDGDTVLYSWTSGSNSVDIPSNVIKTMYYDKEYTIHEVSAPNGYVVADDIKFKFSDYNSENVSIEVTDSKFSVSVGNYDENNQLLAGSTLHIENESGTTLGSNWVTTESTYTVPETVLSQMEYGKKYYIVETDSPAGYGVNTTKKEFTIDSENVNVSFYNFKIGVNIVNYDADGQTLLDDTVLQLIDKETDNEIESWNTSDSNPYQVSADLEVGKDYIIRVKTPKSGHVYVDDVEFTATSDASQNYSITNKKLSLGFRKVGKDGQPLAGALLGLYEEGQTNPLFTWTSTEEDYIVADSDINKINVDRNYYVLETGAPSGYITTGENIPVTINKNSDSLQLIRIENELKTVNALVSVKDKTTTDVLSDIGIELYEGETKVGTFTTSDEAITLSTTGENAKLVYGKSYRLHLTSIPNGYVPSDDIEFTIDDNFENNTNLTFELEKFNITISKVGKDNALIGGAKLELLNAAGTSIHEFTTVEGESYVIPADVINQIAYGDVIKLREKKAPAGYILNTTVKDITINEKNISVDFANTEFGISINNIDKTTTNFLNGTTIQLLDETKSNVIEEWTSNGVHVVDAKLEQGSKYYLHVTNQANGYIVPADVAFIVSNQVSQEKTIENEKFQLTITKVDENNNPLSGAFLSLYEEGSNDALASWNSTDDNPYVIPDEIVNQMNISKNYFVRETTVPLGYDTVTEDFTFVINNVASVQNIQIQNNLKQYDVNITAVDEAGNVVEGATIELYEGTYNDNEVIPQNKLITSWTSTNGAKRFSTIDGRYDTDKLVFGKSYTIRATKTPRNITIDNRETFTIDENSEVTTNKTILAEKFSLTINKLDENNEPLAGAKMALYKQYNETAIVEFTTTNEAYKLPTQYANDIQYGDVLILKELEAPAGYTISEEAKSITINSNDVVVNYTNTPLQVSVNNVINGTTDKLSGTKLQLLDSDDRVLETWTTNDDSHVLTTKLKVGETYKVHVKTPSTGYRPADDIEYTVTNNASQEITVNNKLIRINITKLDSDNNGNPLAGARLGLFRKSNNEQLVEFESTESAYEVPSDVILTIDYNTELYVKELEAPAGYINSSQIVEFSANYEGNTTDIISIYYTNSPLGISIKNADSDENSFLAGTELQLLDSTKENVIEEWTAEENVVHVISAKLKVGNSYYIHVKTPTNGHIVPDDKKITIANTNSQQYTIVNGKFTINVSKLDQDNNRLAGALLELRSGNTVLDRWTSTTDEYTIPDDVIAQMRVGNTYKVVETTVPVGYEVDDTDYVDFTVENTVNPQEVNLKNKLKNLILNINVKNGNTTLEGANLELHLGTSCSAESKLDAWTSEATPKSFNTISGDTIIKYDETYTICETKAADGYIKTSPVQVRIVEDADSEPRTLSVTLNNDALDVRIKNKIVGPETGGEGNNSLAGVEYGLYTDAAGRNPVNGLDGNPYTWTSSSNQSHKITALLTEGATYYVKEISVPDGYDKSASTAFTVQSTGDTQEYTVNVVEHPLDVRIVKVGPTSDSDDTEVVLKDAVFHLYKAKLENGEYVADGPILHTWTSTGKTNACVASDPYSEACGYYKLPLELNGEGNPTLHVGKYIVREAVSPIEYQPNTSPDTEITVSLVSSTQPYVINNRRTNTDIIINKVDRDCPEGESCPVNGSIIKVLDEDNNIVYTNANPEGTPDNFPVRLQGKLIPGHTYTIVEENDYYDANHAYQKAEPFVIDNRDDNHSVLNVESTQTYTIYNDKTVVNSSIINKDFMTGNQLKGAIYKIYQGEFGNTEPIENVDELDPILVWNTDDDDAEHDLSSLVKPGYTYTIVQEKVPYSYKPFDQAFIKNDSEEDNTFSNIKSFKIENVNTEQAFELVNDKKDIDIQVLNHGSDEQYVEDSDFCIYKDEVSDENEVYCWHSYGIVNKLEVPTEAGQGYRKYKFEVGATYIIHQTRISDDYEPLDEDLVFTVEDTEDKQPPAEDDGIIYIENKKLLSLVIDVIGDEALMYQPISGITLQILDSNGNVILDEEGKPKYEWTTDETGRYIAVDLPAPNTYIIRQKKVPSKYVKSNDIVFQLLPIVPDDEDVDNYQVATFLVSEKKVLDNPETGDNIIKFVIIGISSLVAVLLGIFIYKKANKKKG